MNPIASRWVASMVLTVMLLSFGASQEIRYDEGWCVGGQVLSRGERASFARHFQRDYTYLIEVRGDSRARDIDLQILDADGRLLAQDIGSNKEARVRFTPRRSGDYTIRLTLSEATGRALCYFIVFREDGGGWKVPESDLESAIEKLAALTQVISDNYQVQRFYGFIMRTGERHNIRISGLESGRYVVAAVGDDWANDIDLAVFREGRLLDSDDLDDPVPITEFRASDTIEARVHYVAGSGPALVMMALYEPAKPDAERR